MKRISSKWKAALFLVIISAFLFLGGGKEVEAATKCRVTFANAQGVVSAPAYRDWAKTVDAGSWIQLPEYSQSGYKCYWVIKEGKKLRRYYPGANYKITKNTKFCLYRYKKYKVAFWTENGKKEYLSLREEAIKGQYITLPPVPHNASTRGLGWSTTLKGKNYKKPGTKVKVTGNMKFYPVTRRISGVKLRSFNGKLWRVVETGTGKNPTFPSVNMCSGNMVLGWSRTKGQTSHPEFVAGDRIPTKSGNYYMVVFGKHMDKRPAILKQPEKHDKVYFVGDSRTVGMRKALGSAVPPNVDFVAKGGEGLEWFQQVGYRQLLSKVRASYNNSNGTAEQAVVINFGVNDLRNYKEYTRYMSRVAKYLRKNYNCDMYYMSVNPVNSAMIASYGAGRRTEHQVNIFNKNLISTLCRGQNKCYAYINTHSFLQRYGWISDKFDAEIYDGLHYSSATYLRVYNYCMNILNR